MVPVISKCLKRSGFGLFGLLGLMSVACEQTGSGTQQAAVPVSAAQVTQVALENPVRKCEQDQAKCVGSASDAASAVQCNDAFRECLAGAADVGQQMAQAAEQCRETAAQCATTGGATGASSCATGYESCLNAVTAEPAPPVAGAPGMPQRPGGAGRLPQLPSAGGLSLPMRPGLPGTGGIGGLPRLPGLPSAGGVAIPTGPTIPTIPTIPSLPGAAGRGGLPSPRRGLPSDACFEQLRMCAQAPNADLNQCATAARSCLRGSASPTGAAGAGGRP